MIRIFTHFGLNLVRIIAGSVRIRVWVPILIISFLTKNQIYLSVQNQKNKNNIKYTDLNNVRLNT